MTLAFIKIFSNDDSQLKYNSGSSNSAADSLSRAPLSNGQANTTEQCSVICDGGYKTGMEIA